MDTKRKQSPASNSKIKDNSHHQVGAAASQLLNESKKMANELYEEGCHRVQDAQDTVKEYSDELVRHVRENPLASVLIAGGVGFLLSALLRK